MRGAVDRREGVARERLRMAERGSMLDAIFGSCCLYGGRRVLLSR
jgi:hypothetical protein